LLEKKIVPAVITPLVLTGPGIYRFDGVELM
jgi:hypothetical protein